MPKAIARAARVVYAEAVKHNPDDPMGRVNLGNILQALGEMTAARAEYDAALALDPAQREAHRGLAQLSSAIGDEPAAERHRGLAFRDRPVTVLPYRGAAEPVPLLVLVSARDGNLAYETIIDEDVFETIVLVAEFFDETTALPRHRLILNAIGEADLCSGALARAQSVVAKSAAPVVNQPDAVRVTGRSGNAERLGGLPRRARAEDPRIAPGWHRCRRPDRGRLRVSAADPGAGLPYGAAFRRNPLARYARRRRRRPAGRVADGDRISRRPRCGRQGAQIPGDVRRWPALSAASRHFR
ncbi:MAG: tetratricopeptide repeat protein [Aliidongia sp.]